MLWIQAEAPAAPISPWIVLTLVLIVAASSSVFWILVRRWTTHRYWHLLAAWAGARRFRLTRGDGERPAPLEQWASVNPRVELLLAGSGTHIMEVLTDAIPGLPRDQVARWRVLVREIEHAWPPTALRPVMHAASVVDLFSLSSYPSLAATDRFVVFGSDARAARVLSSSMARALLPPDVALVISGQHLLLDFSSRAFDPIEFDRMLALAEQLAAHLPAVTVSSGV
jgi:hypothetical protein